MSQLIYFQPNVAFTTVDTYRKAYFLDLMKNDRSLYLMYENNSYVSYEVIISQNHQVYRHVLIEHDLPALILRKDRCWKHSGIKKNF